MLHPTPYRMYWCWSTCGWPLLALILLLLTDRPTWHGQLVKPLPIKCLARYPMLPCCCPVLQLFDDGPWWHGQRVEPLPLSASFHVTGVASNRFDSKAVGATINRIINGRPAHVRPPAVSCP